MKTILKFLSLSICLFLVSSGKAQELAYADSTAIIKPAPVFNRSAGVHAGSQGLGLEIQQPLPYFLNLRLGASVLPNLKTSGVYSLGGFNTDVKGHTNGFWNAHLLVDFQPFNQAPTFPSSFKYKLIVTAGVAYFPHAKASALIMLNEDYKFGDMTFSPAEVGQITAVSTWTGFAPYAGVGVNHVLSADRYSMGVNLGSYYMKSPEVAIRGTKMLAGNETNSAKLSDAMASFRWLPVLQVSFNYHLPGKGK